MKKLGCTMCILAFSSFSAESVSSRKKKLGCILCIIAFLSFSAEINELKEVKKTRMHILHPSFFILQLTGSADISEVKNGKAWMHIVHPSFFILQLTPSAEISEVPDEIARMHIDAS